MLTVSQRGRAVMNAWLDPVFLVRGEGGLGGSVILINQEFWLVMRAAGAQI